MKRKRLYREIIFSILFWVFATNFFLLLRYIGVKEEGETIISWNIFIDSTIGGALFGIVFGFFESSNFLKIHIRKSFGFLVIIKTIMYTFFFLLVTFITILIGESLETAIDFIYSEDNLALLLHLAFFSLLFHFIRQMSKKFGPDVFLEYITGKYFHPKEEERIFMFLDLKSSTTIAEKIGHIAYSKLIQDCFALLTEPLIKHQAQVYQYVGDEIVITWKTEYGLANLNCIKFFFAFIQKLKDKKEYFIKSNGVFPEFKAGMDMGLVTVAEVGEIKSEIAYHGDTLNTASRIQGLCNDFNEQFLASESIINCLDNKKGYKTQFIDNLYLKGKENKVKVFNIISHL